MFVKCPKCELNYKNAADKMCKVCYREIHGAEPPEEFELCSVCNEAVSLAGKDICQLCLSEMAAAAEDDVDGDQDRPAITGDESVSTMDEIAPGLEDGDINDPEYRGMDGDLSLEELEEKEDQEGDDGDEDEDG